jgi:GTP 3',8-cyclase
MVGYFATVAPTTHARAAGAVGPPVMTDAFGRAVRAVRVSVTDACNLRCRYCMPAQGLPRLPRDEVLRRDEIARIVRVLAARGVTEVRVTGGEPLLRPDLAGIIADMAATPGVREVSLTTNGVMLADALGDLVSAGLSRVNVSMDSLDPDRFAAVTRRRDLDRVRDGLDACERHPGLGTTKVNAVLLRGVGEDDVLPLAEMARRRRLVVRFIEAMPLDADGAWEPGLVISGAEVRAAIARRWPLTPLARERTSAPATRWRFTDGAGEVQFVSSVTEPFCAACDRVRVTADGQLRTCLFASRETDLRTAIRAGGDDDALASLIACAVDGKPAGHGIGMPGWRYDGRPMSRIGG